MCTLSSRDAGAHAGAPTRAPTRARTPARACTPASASASASATWPRHVVVLVPCVVTLFVVLLFVGMPMPTMAYTRVGCYRDQRSANDASGRDLNDQLFLEESMTLDKCDEMCGERDTKYFGVQFGIECWCGDSYGKHGEHADAAQCGMPCPGDRSQQCGGELANHVFEVTPEKRKPKVVPDPNAQPLIGLVMMVKNEAHTLANTLLPLRPYIDYYWILDTGSTDGTQDVIRKVLGTRGEIIEEPFIDYGRSRNRALDIVQTAKNPSVFSLMLSADETVYNARSLRRFCEQHRDSSGPAHEAYPIVMDVGWRFDSLRLSRTDKGWRYVGRVHEYLASPDKSWHPTLRVPDSYIKFVVTDPERRSQREYTILRILQEETAEKPTDTRASFYLARTYNVIGNHSAALDEFRRRVSLGGWQEEVYESLFAIAWQLEALGRPWSEVQEAFLDAHQHSSERAEPLYAIARHYYQLRKFALAYLYASHAASLPYPRSAVLWVQAAVYEWQCHFIVGMAAHTLGPRYYRTGARSLMIAKLKQPHDPVIAEQFEKYKQTMPGEEFDELQRETGLLPPLPVIAAPAQDANVAAAADGGDARKPDTEQLPTKDEQRPSRIVDPEEERVHPKNVDGANAAGVDANGNGSSSMNSMMWFWISFACSSLTVLLIAAAVFFLRRGKGIHTLDGHYSDKIV